MGTLTLRTVGLSGADYGEMVRNNHCRIKVTESWPACHGFDSQCRWRPAVQRGLMHVKYVKAQTFFRRLEGDESVSAQMVDDVATQVEEDISQTIDSTSVRRAAASVYQPHSTVHKILR
ncbi:hypothetical protein TNCV_2411671 [Trichonephila clavipes]|nr:hypothetical protein TNCV_2411671 [Trichonephila clavipes]